MTDLHFPKVLKQSRLMESGLNYLLYGGNTMQGSQLFSEAVNPELDHKVKRVTEKFSENMHIVANEPSLAYYRIQEHIRKSLPQLVDQRHEVESVHQNVQGACFDMEYAIGAVKGMHSTGTHFQNIQDLLKNALFMKQQIEYENSRKQQEKSNPSMYRAPMFRHNTLDIPVSINTTSEDRGEQSQASSLLSQATAAFLPDPKPRRRSSSVDGGRNRKNSKS